jgi:hypothetical protein
MKMTVKIISKKINKLEIALMWLSILELWEKTIYNTQEVWGFKIKGRKVKEVMIKDLQFINWRVLIKQM